MTTDKTKFNVDKAIEKRSCNGIIFDSVLEMRYYKEVVLPKYERGEISHYELQKPYILQEEFSHEGMKVHAIRYVADFYLVYADGSEEVVDTKGMPDAVAKLKRKLFWRKYPDLQYTWVCYSQIDGGWQTYEYVQKQRRIRKKNKQNVLEKKEKKQNGKKGSWVRS